MQHPKPRDLSAKRVTRILGLIAALLVALAACGEGLGGWLVSDQDEVEIGVSVDQQIEGEYQIVQENDPATLWARQLVAPLEAASTGWRDPADIGGYKVKVIADNDLVNAFAAPGGFTYITTGLITQASTCAEIAGVMGHELAHVTERHGVKRLEQVYGVQMLSQWLLGEGIASDAALLLYQVAIDPQYSQADEAESDEIGLQIAFNAGYNPYGIVDFFGKLLALSEGSVGMPQIFSSHPDTQARIDTSTTNIQRLYGSTVVRGQSQSYNCVGTTQTLEQIQAHITSGQLAIR